MYGLRWRRENEAFERKVREEHPQSSRRKACAIRNIKVDLCDVLLLDARSYWGGWFGDGQVSVPESFSANLLDGFVL